MVLDGVVVAEVAVVDLPFVFQACETDGGGNFVKGFRGSGNSRVNSWVRVR